MFGQSLMEMFVQSLKHVHDPRSQHGVSHFICSFDSDVVSASECQGFVLHHCDVENGLYLQKDKYYGEDKHVFRRTDLAEVGTVLTNIGLSLARLYHKGKRT